MITGNIKDMHYDFKQRLNRIDSNAYVGLKIPDIDRVLNRAINLYMLLVAEPRLRSQLGFEVIKRSTDDIRVMVKNSVQLIITKVSDTNYGIIPEDYLYYLSTDTMLATKGGCIDKKLKTTVIKHDDRSNDDTFYTSDFDWGECNIRFSDEGIRIFNNDFEVTKFSINYLKKHPYVHNAQDFANGSYTLPDGRILGTVAEPFVDCKLPSITHDEIVDLAVLLTTGDLNSPVSYQFKQNVLKLEQLIN